MMKQSCFLPSVAPLSLSLWDERFSDYSLSVIKPQCVEKYQRFQREALSRLDELIESIGDWATQNNLTTSSNGYDLSDRLQAEIALSWITMASNSYDLACDAIPTQQDETLAYADFMYQGSQFVFLVDEGLSQWLPYHMQAAMELGNFSAPVSHLSDLLTFDVTDFGINLMEHQMPQFRPEQMAVTVKIRIGKAGCELVLLQVEIHLQFRPTSRRRIRFE